MNMATRALLSIAFTLDVALILACFETDHPAIGWIFIVLTAITQVVWLRDAIAEGVYRGR